MSVFLFGGGGGNRAPVGIADEVRRDFACAAKHRAFRLTAKPQNPQGSHLAGRNQKAKGTR